MHANSKGRFRMRIAFAGFRHPHIYALYDPCRTTAEEAEA